MLKNRRFPKELSSKKACELLKVSRNTVYYKEKGESKDNQRLMEEIEEIYAHDPTIGYRRMRAILKLNFDSKTSILAISEKTKCSKNGHK